MRRDLPIALLALASGVGAASVGATSEQASWPAASAVLTLLVGSAYVGSGLVARRHRPDNRLGQVMIFIGFAWFVAALADAGQSLPFSLGKATEDLPLLGFVYLVLAFPSGRLRTLLDRVLVAAAVILTTFAQIAWLGVTDSRVGICTNCPRNALEVARNDTAA